jgi:hypothetical protein
MIAMAANHSQSSGRDLMGAVHFVNTLSRLDMIWDKILSNPTQSRKPSPEVPANKTKPTWLDLDPEYRRVFQLPRAKRLERIAQVAARYNLKDDSRPFVDKLRLLPTQFLEKMLAEYDMTYFLWPAISKYVLDEPPEFWMPSRQFVSEIVDEYILFFKEMKNQADRLGATLTVVLIP